MNNENANFLIIETAFLGDVILTTGVAEKLHSHYPDANIDYLIKTGHEPLFIDHPFIRKVFTYDKKNKISSLPSVVRQLRKEHYTYLVNTHRYLSSGIFSLLCRASMKIGYRDNPCSFIFDQAIEFNNTDGRRAIDRYHDLINDITDITPCLPKLYPPDLSSNYQQRPYITISPCSQWKTKEWPDIQWQLFIEQLPKEYTVYLLGAQQDHTRLEKIVSNCQSQLVINTSMNMTMLQSVGLMRNASMNYVLDSAPMHMASAVDAPVTTLYISTGPEYGFVPMSTKSEMIQTANKLSCKPCGPHGFSACPKGHFKCAEIDYMRLNELLPKEIKIH